ncbi:sugar transferase [Candidatus Peregrinibacteria bacterium]|nr:sugar transferase [Candidatus Peregrinibacteria bacterium]
MRNFLRLISQKKIAVLTLVLSDLCAFFVSFSAAYSLRNFFGESIQPFDVYLQAFFAAFVLLILVFYFFGLYEQKIRIEGTSEIFAIIKGVLMAAVVFMAASFMYKYDYSRGFVIALIFTSLVFINVGRLAVRMFNRWLVKKGLGITNVLIIGAGKPGRKLAAEIKRYNNFGYRIVGFLDDSVVKEKSVYPILGKIDTMNRIINEKNISMVFISDPNMPHERMLSLISGCENTNIKFKLVSNLYEILTGSIDISEIEGIPSIDLGTGKKHLIYKFFKRFLDVVFAVFGVVLFSWLFLLMGFLIRVDSKGRAFFKQKRVGLNGRIFNMYKFRTMHADTNMYEEAPRKADDRRITRMGGFLRKTSLDELPQLINILKGEMSFVGPRPEMPFIVEKYTEWQKTRLQVKPGLTGLWQILGRKDLPLHENLEYDFYYIQNQSLLLDVVIMIKTVWAVITGKGAF